MRLKVNGQRRDIEVDELDVAALLEQVGVEERRGVAVAVNNRVVPKSQWEDHRLDEGDAVEIIRATQGG